jgi:DNA-binding transcriptional MerR regulator
LYFGLAVNKNTPGKSVERSKFGFRGFAYVYRKPRKLENLVPWVFVVCEHEWKIAGDGKGLRGFRRYVKKYEKSFRGIRKGNLENMMNTEYVKLTEAARKLTVHADTLRYWVKLLGVETMKRGHACYILAETLGILTIMASLIADGMPAGEAATRAKAEAPAEATAMIVRETSRPGPEMEALQERLQGLEKVILSMAETFKTEINGLRGEISQLAETNRKLQQRLEAPTALAEAKEPIKPVVPWEPRKGKNPVAGMPWYKKIWVECFEPWKMRHQAY